MMSRIDTMIEDRTAFRGSLRTLTLAGVAGVALFAGTVGVWAVATTISGAVVASGQIVVDGDVKKVQHATGGVVGELAVSEGDRVEKGQVVLRLDDTATRANLQILAKQLDEFASRRARLQAERDRKPEPAVPAELAARLDEPDIAELVLAERTLFEARRAARDGQKAQLGKRIAQLQEEIAGIEAQEVARARQEILIGQELEGVQILYAKNLIALSRKTTLERAAATLDGQKGQFTAAIAQSQGKIAETQLQIIQIDDGLREEVMKELREVQGKMAELAERRIAAEDQLRRVDIRSPSAGFVHQLAIHTVGGVLAPAEAAMLIVPANETLQLEARVSPPDIDQIALHRPVHIKMHAFNQRSTPELAGTVSRISADTMRDPQSGAAFYTVRISVPPEELARLTPNRIAMGMQADVFIKTEDRTPLGFILKPLKDQLAKAFRER